MTGAYAGHFPYVIRQLLGPRSVTTICGQYHTQLRKVINPHFTPKAVAAYTPRLVELAQQACMELAHAAKPKGEDAMKKFTFKACFQWASIHMFLERCCVQVCLPAAVIADALASKQTTLTS